MKHGAVDANGDVDSHAPNFTLPEDTHADRRDIR